MSSGSLIELSALGSLDQAVAQLAGKHRISPWQGVTPASTNFAVDHSISSIQSGAPTGDGAQEVVFKLNRAGDLCHSAVLQIELPVLNDSSGDAQYVWGAGFKAVQSAKLVIGGQELEKLSGRWLEMWSELTQAPGVKPMAAVNKYSAVMGEDIVTGMSGEHAPVLHVPIGYYFTQSTAKALRSVALAYHDVEFRIRLSAFSDLHTPGTGPTASTKTWGDCKVKLITGSVYLDAREREETARACVEQVVCMTSALVDVDSASGRTWGTTKDFLIDNLPFNHPTRALVIAVGDKSRTDATAATGAGSGGKIASKIATGKVFYNDGRVQNVALPKNDFDYRLASGGKVLPHSLSGIQIKLNNHDRLTTDIHAGFYNTTTTSQVGYVPRNGIYLVPFSLNIKQEAGGMAVGSLNLSRVDRSSITLTCPEEIADKEVWVYSSHYNVVSVRNGMSGLRFSN